MKKTTKVNGNVDLDTPDMKEMRRVVAEQELTARSWKAYYEKMYYSLEGEKLETEYKEFQKRTEEKLKAEKKKYEDAIAAVTNLTEDTPIKLEEVNGN